MYSGKKTALQLFIRIW